MSTKQPTRYRLRVSAGPSADDLKPVNVNDDANPMFIESKEFVGQLVVRIRGLDKAFGYAEAQEEDGLKTFPDSAWFTRPGGNNNLSSVQISGRFKNEWEGSEVVFGNQFEKPLRLPPFSSIALKFIQFIDPGLKADIYCDRPWAFSPLIATMNTVNVSGWHIDEATQAKADQSGETERLENLESELPPWPSPDGEHIIEDTSLLFKGDSNFVSDKKKKKAAAATTQQNDQDDSTSQQEEEVVVADTKNEATKNLSVGERRSFFSKEANLSKHRYRPDQVYGFDFFNPFLNFANFTLKVPGFSVDITRYWDGQPLTYVVKSRDSSAVFFAFQYEILPVNDNTID
ncbi:hypothetical protein BGZ76_011231 [Entomortierella beljakovae]|nr:hypothetical protein BGZ76_011231 [Entomortierella beljakovae]